MGIGRHSDASEQAKQQETKEKRVDLSPAGRRKAALDALGDAVDKFEAGASVATAKPMDKALALELRDIQVRAMALFLASAPTD